VDRKKIIFKHQSTDFETQPIKKLADIVSSEGNYDFIDGMNLEDSVKQEYKSKVANELVRQKKAPLTKKGIDNLTTSEQSKLETLDDVNIDNLITTIQDGGDINKILGEELDKSIDMQLDTDLDKDLEEGLDEESQKEEEQALKDIGVIEATPEQIAAAEQTDDSIQIGEDSKQEIDKEIKDSGQEDTKKKPKISDAPEDSNYFIKSEKSIVSKLSNPKIEKLIKEKENSKESIAKTDLKALKNEKARRAEAKAKKKPSKAAKEANEIDSPNFYIESEKSIVSKLTNKRLDELIKEKKTKRDKESEGLVVKEKMQLAAEIQSLESEKERRADSKKDKNLKSEKIKEDIDSKRAPVSLGSSLDSAMEEAFADAGIQSYEEIMKQAEAGKITVEESSDIKQEVEDNTEELKNKNCL